MVLMVVILVIEPSDAGVLPPEYRNPYGASSSAAAAQMIHQHQQQQQHESPPHEQKQPHQWSTNPVEEWAKEQVRILINLFIGFL